MINPIYSPKYLRRNLQKLLLCGVLLLPVATPAAFAAPVTAADAVQDAFIRAAQKIKPSVVTIYVQRGSSEANGSPGMENEPTAPLIPPLPDGERSGLGSGVVVDTQGTILTNYHVVKNATIIRVLFNTDESQPERAVARLAGFDEESDLAVIQLITPSVLRTPLQPAQFANSDQVQVGDWAIAVGAPFDQAQSVTVGVISARGRHLDRDNRLSLQDYLQTDASINPGNSGGPLLNLEGQVIGINTAILSPSRYNVGIGFAVPSNTATSYWPLLKAGNSIDRGFLGIRYLPLDEQVAREFNIAGGMQIGGLAQRDGKFIGPAQAAGLQEGDIITHVNGRGVVSTQEFRKQVATLPPGSRVEFTVLRPMVENAQPHTLTVTLGDWNEQFGQNPEEKPKTPPAPAGFTRSGLRLSEIDKLTSVQRAEMGVGENDSGILITEVLPGSPADIAQLHRGLRIEKVRGDDKVWLPVPEVEDFVKIEAALPSQARLLLQARDRQHTFLYKAIEFP